jgi:hypothetical protein
MKSYSVRMKDGTEQVVVGRVELFDETNPMIHMVAIKEKEDAVHFFNSREVQSVSEQKERTRPLFTPTFTPMFEPQLDIKKIAKELHKIAKQDRRKRMW